MTVKVSMRFVYNSFRSSLIITKLTMTGMKLHLIDVYGESIRIDHDGMVWIAYRDEAIGMVEWTEKMGKDAPNIHVF